MRKRLQVRFEEAEYRRLQEAARDGGVTVSEWVRQAIRAALTQVSMGVPARKLAAIRVASRHSFPAPDIDRMLDEISRGRGGEIP